MNKKRKLLIIAPHGDDEINLVGTIINQLKKHFNIQLILVTNGDYIPKFTEQRHRETLLVVEKMGISRVHFLGYADNPAFDNRHIFYMNKTQAYTSPVGKSSTYCVGGFKDYAFDVSGQHHIYCRENVKSDMKSCIKEVNAEMIICVDFDEHADHRMTSLLFDEIMCELIRTTDYHPVVLKKYAYAGVWFGNDDYYCNPMKETVLTEEEYFPYSPKQEIRVKVPRIFYPVFYRRSWLYRLCGIYQSQYVIEHFPRMVNADALYFYRDTNNLALNAKIKVTSGKKEYLNDFKLIDTAIINATKEEIMANYFFYTWVPDETDLERKAEFFFDKPIEVQELHLSFPFQTTNRPKQVSIEINETVKIVRVTDYYEVVTFEESFKNVRSVQIRIIEGEAGKCGISEIEIFESPSLFPWSNTPLKKYNPNSILRYRPGSTLIPKIEKNIYTIKMFFQYDLKGNGIGYYIKKAFSKFKR